MAQYRQSGGGNGPRNGVVSDHVSIGFRGVGGARQFHHHRRLKGRVAYKISIGFCVLTLFFILAVSGYFHFSLPSKGGDISRHLTQDDDMGLDRDFLMDVTRTQKSRELKFGQGSVVHGRDSRYWDKDDRRRDVDYHEEELEKSHDGSVDKLHATGKNNDDRSYFNKSHNIGESTDMGSKTNQQFGDADDYDDDGIDLDDNQMEEYDDVGLDDHGRKKKKDLAEEAEIVSNDLFREESLSNSQHSKVKSQTARKLIPEKRPSSKKKKRRKFSGSCEMKILNSTAQLVEPLQSRKFARFSLQYTEKEEKPIGDEKWEPRFAGHQSLSEREASFIARDQKINCGFVKGPTESKSTGFDLAEDDAKYISSCHIAVMSCIFGNSDRLRSPIGKTVSRLSKKNVCFVMFVDKITLQTVSSEGQMPDAMGFVGLWKIVVVKNLPYTDMRRVGKIPKFLPHRLFPSARYSIWLDSKLRLQRDPLLILEYFLWRKNHEYAISNHYDRHCLWEEVAQNKRLNKYNHSIIDEQFGFYQADGMKRFNASDANKLLPSNVPEGSFIVRAHTPMSNLFSCLWFNEVDRFTPRDQLSFAYTYHKLRRMNPEKPFYLHMFKDCERRKMAKLYRHRSEESKNSLKRELE